MNDTCGVTLSAVVTPGVTVVYMWAVLFHERKSDGTGGFSHQNLAHQYPRAPGDVSTPQDDVAQESEAFLPPCPS